MRASSGVGEDHVPQGAMACRILLPKAGQDSGACCVMAAHSFRVPASGASSSACGRVLAVQLGLSLAEPGMLVSSNSSCKARGCPPWLWQPHKDDILLAIHIPEHVRFPEGPAQRPGTCSMHMA